MFIFLHFLWLISSLLHSLVSVASVGILLMSNVEDGIAHFLNNPLLNSRKNISLLDPTNKGGLGGISATVSGPKLDHKYLGLGEGFDVVMGSPEEESPMGSVETTKRPRFLTKDLKVSLVKDFTGDNSPTSAGLDHGLHGYLRVHVKRRLNICGILLWRLFLVVFLQHDYDKWCPPSSPHYKINVGASAMLVDSKSSSSFLVLDSMGNIIGAGFRINDSITSVFSAEVEAILQELEFSRDLGLHRVVEGDNKAVIEKLNAHSQDFSDIGPKFRDIKFFAGFFFTSCVFRFIGTSGNQLAHVLASEGLNSSMDRFWVDDAPPLV
ncbi:hypothetical protein V6N11_057520 [Hibiscus sabdariffa]|uniref:RNase H type-1 domain-containing protein n=1 Tax=Hibiscus sabdariffa TaxID=183260 RepID=A0ABR2NH20_9ROSI